jgi:hypothetical protein
MPECFFAHLGGCEGRLVKAHLIPKSSIKRELSARLGRHCVHTPKTCPYGAVCADCGMAEILAAIWDERCWRWMCGGAVGLSGHHGAYDAKQIRLDEWPQDFVEFLVEHEIHWMTEAYAR